MTIIYDGGGRCSWWKGAAVMMMEGRGGTWYSTCFKCSSILSVYNGLPQFLHIKFILCVSRRIFWHLACKKRLFVCVSAYTVKEITNLWSRYAYKSLRLYAKKKNLHALSYTYLCMYMLVPKCVNSHYR
jgi:hypothetical protein